MLESPMAGQRQGLFLFREAAGFLAAVMRRGRGKTAAAAFESLRKILQNADGFAHRTAAEALGGLPYGIRPPALLPEDEGPAPVVSWRRVAQTAGIDSDRVLWRGRSLTVGPDTRGRLLVCKMARQGESGESLAREVSWMTLLRGRQRRLPVRFDVPDPVRIEGRRRLRIRTADAAGAPGAALDPSGTACAFVAAPDYFRYPNETAGSAGLSGPAFLKVMGQNAFLLGRLAAEGIVHRSPIPLFHNRVQVQRRRDKGCYEWFRAGRLDRWLASCRYPNFGPTGLRDFEHLDPLGDAHLSLYRAVGSHFLSLLLVAASYFRNRAPAPPEGKDRPLDVRHLFDPLLLHEAVLEIFSLYYRGITGKAVDFRLPLDVPHLVARMIDEMGVDRHMEEVLRKADQVRMSEDEFRGFLQERGEAGGGAVRGAADIVLRTGPHLGAFNDVISLPELIGAVEAFSGLCVAGRFRSAAG